MRTCNVCGEAKPLSEFRLGRNGRALYRRCKKCYHKLHWVWCKQNPINVMLQSAKFRAKRDGLPFLLKRSDITIPDVCPVLGIKLQCGDRKNHDAAPTLDRITSELGYVAGNVIVVSYRANRIKNDATLVELKQIHDFYVRMRESQWTSFTQSEARSA